MLLAPKKTIRGIPVVLPYTAYGLLDGQRIRHLSYLLEFIYTNHYLYAFLLCYPLWQIEYLLWGIALRRDAKRKSIFTTWLRTIDNFGRIIDIYKKVLYQVVNIIVI